MHFFTHNEAFALKMWHAFGVKTFHEAKLQTLVKCRLPATNQKLSKTEEASFEN